MKLKVGDFGYFKYLIEVKNRNDDGSKVFEKQEVIRLQTILRFSVESRGVLIAFDDCSGFTPIEDILGFRKLLVPEAKEGFTI